MASKTFTYQSLSTEDCEIRLLHFLPDKDKQGEIKCALQNMPLDNCPGYQALSYTLGDGQTTRDVTINGESFPVTENLYSALRQLRNDLVADPWLWVDAICINQASVEERNNQVPLMTEIYRKARATCAWLGEEADNSNLIMDLTSWLFEDEERTEERFQTIVDDPNYGNYFRSLYHLYSRPYFKRMWVIQEMLAAEKILAFCGTKAVFMTHLLKIGHLITLYLDERHRENHWLSEIESVKPVQSLYKDMIANMTADYIQSLIGTLGRKPQDPLEVVVKYRKQLCTDPRDKIYGLFGLMARSHRQKLVVDYSLTLAQVYREFATYVVSTSEKLNIICLASSSMDSVDFPSWVPDWRHEVNFRSQFLALPNMPYSAAGTSKAITTFKQEGRVMAVKGLVIYSIDTIAENVKQSAVKTSKLCFVFRQWLRLALDSSGLENSSENERARILDDFWRTVIFNRGIAGGKAPDNMRQSFDSLCIRCRVTNGLDIDAELDEVSFESFLGDTPDEYTALMILALAERKFFTLTSAFFSMGVAPATTQTGICFACS